MTEEMPSTKLRNSIELLLVVITGSRIPKILTVYLFVSFVKSSQHAEVELRIGARLPSPSPSASG